MLDMDYLERMALELLEQQLAEACVIIEFPSKEDYDYAA